jgi:hypothetical protein
MIIILLQALFYLNTKQIWLQKGLDPTHQTKLLPASSSSVAATAAECGTQLTILMSEIQDWLRQVGSLDNTANLDSTLILNQLAHQEQQFRGELKNLVLRITLLKGKGAEYIPQSTSGIAMRSDE